jgi:hypothetical protein
MKRDQRRQKSRAERGRSSVPTVNYTQAAAVVDYGILTYQSIMSLFHLFNPFKR